MHPNKQEKALRNLQYSDNDLEQSNNKRNPFFCRYCCHVPNAGVTPSGTTQTIQHHNIGTSKLFVYSYTMRLPYHTGKKLTAVLTKAFLNAAKPSGYYMYRQA